MDESKLRESHMVLLMDGRWVPEDQVTPEQWDLLQQAFEKKFREDERFFAERERRRRPSKPTQGRAESGTTT